MKKILLILALIMPLILSAQPDIINFDPAVSATDSAWQSIDIDTLYFSKDSTYITGDGDTIKFVVDDTEGFQIVNIGTDISTVFDPLGTFGTATNPTIAFGDGNTGFYENSDNVLYLSIVGLAKWRFEAGRMGSQSNAGPQIIKSVPTATLPTFVPGGNDTDTGIGKADADTLSLIAGGVEGIRIAEGGGNIKVSITDTLAFDNGAIIHNEETDTLFLIETIVKIEGDLHITGDLHVEGTESKHADMFLNNNGNPTTMETASSPIGMIHFTTGDQHDFTFDAGGTGAITAYADFGIAAGDTVTVTDNGHGLSDEDFIVIRGTTNYNGVWQIGLIDVNSFYIVDTWVADDGASDWEEPSYLQLTAGSGETFHVSWHLSAQKAGGASATVQWCVYKNTTALDKTISQREMPGTDIGSISGGGLIGSVSAGDRFFMVIESDNTNDITNRFGTLILVQE